MSSLHPTAPVDGSRAAVTRATFAPGAVLETSPERLVFSRTSARPAVGRGVAALFVLLGVAALPRVLGSELPAQDRMVAALVALVLLGFGITTALGVGEVVCVELVADRAILRRTGVRAASATASPDALRVEVTGGAHVAEVRARLDGVPLTVSLGSYRRSDAERLADAVRAFRVVPAPEEA